MAGQIEEPPSFESSSLHSGSISFGRFETESLSWEKRSAFSHNRYLEEVEKYSTPGSVTQKKAYFEAHFKKKALLRQPSECQSGVEYQTSDEILDHLNYMEEFEHSNEGAHFGHYDESPDDSDDHVEYNVVGWERENEEISADHGQYNAVGSKNEGGEISTDHVEYDMVGWESQNGEIPADHGQYNAVGSKSEGGEISPNHGEYDVVGHEKEGDEISLDYGGHEVAGHENEGEEISPDHGEYEVVGHENEGEDILPEFQMASTIDDAGAVSHSDSEHLEPCELDQNQVVHKTQFSVKDEPEVEVKDLLAHETINIDELPRSSDQTPESLTSEKDNGPSMREDENCSKAREEEIKTAQHELRTQLTVADGETRTANETSKDSSNVTRRMATESPVRTKPKKLSRRKAPVIASHHPKTMKQEDCENLRAKQSQENKSRKDQSTDNAGNIPQSSVPDKSETRSRRITNRPKQNLNSTKQDIKLNVPIFRSDERAERRRQFYMKLEEKMHAKEAEMNQLQAKMQEETEAEMKQLRRSLNFKATPMPSFYHPRGSDDKKALSTHAKSTKSRSKSTSPGSRAATRSSTATKSGQKQDIHVTESMRSLPHLQKVEQVKCSSETDISSQNLPAHKTRTTPAAKRTESTTGKKGKEKMKDCNVQKQRGSESSSKLKKGERIDGKQLSTAARNSSSEIMRKMKGISISGNSRIDRLSVDVAS